MRTSIPFGGGECRAFQHEECPKHHEHKGNPGVTYETCRGIGEKAQAMQRGITHNPC